MTVTAACCFNFQLFGGETVQLLICSNSIDLLLIILQFSGVNCSVPIWLEDSSSASSPDLSRSEDGGGAGTAVGIIVTILIMTLTITITVYYRKRFHTLKTQLTHVHYSTHDHNNQDNCGGRNRAQSHHFDNPVYATCRARESDHATLNNTRLHNTIVKNINRSREKSSTLPASRRVACLGGIGASSGSGVCVDDDELSDTISEKGRCWYHSVCPTPRICLCYYGHRNLL